MKTVRKQVFSAFLIVALFVITGCASVLVKETRSFKTTGLFDRSCTKEERDRFSQKFSKIENESAQAAQCRAPDLELMVEKFSSIKETQTIREGLVTKEILGDTIEQVREKGFRIYWDESKGKRVPNCQALYGDEALAVLGMSVGGGARGQDAESTAYFKGRHYGEACEEEDVLRVIDRICINTRNSLKKGNTYTFVVLWRDGYVLRRVIKGGSIDHPTSEHALLLCPGEAIAGGIEKGAEIGIKAVIP